MKRRSKKRYWANVSDVFVSEARRRAQRAEKGDEDIWSEFRPETFHPGTSENPLTRTTFLQAPLKAVLQCSLIEMLLSLGPEYVLC